ncbi:hypothetical protein PO878_02110 [Iamia majanohamensis]|uniref:Uncharacterized protein n=1 Tax=Iamia majanohamensis TaxID=467976 RepID=A0AAE9YAE1_9ACTN|nr:hypothetical protein [Iamia majanohamensis]WCO67513.1 hypothetical protein PO878_02110 [Iamia majanohamensis]
MVPTTRTMRTRLLVTAVATALLVASCGGDGGGEDATADAVAADTPTADAGAADEGGDAEDADEGGDADGAGTGDEAVEGCPEETRLGVTVETTYEGDREVVPADTAFPAGHFTFDLDGSGYGPILHGVLSTAGDEDAESLAVGEPDPPEAGTFRVLVLLEGPPEGTTEPPLGVYDVTYEDGTVDATEGMGLAELDVQEGDGQLQAGNFNELEITHVGEGLICGEIRPVDRSEETSQAPTTIEGEFVATYSEQP